MLWPFKNTIPAGSFEQAKHILQLNDQTMTTCQSMSLTMDGHVGQYVCWMYMPFFFVLS